MVPRIFRKTAAQMMRQKAIYMLITIIGGTMFASVFYLADDDKLTGMVIGIICFALFIAVLIFISNLKDVIQLLRNGEDWTVEVSDEKLSWFSPLPKQMRSFDAALCDIACVEHKLVKSRLSTQGSAKRRKETFKIHFHNKKSLKINPFQSGINPYDVFKELERRGIKFDQLQEWSGSHASISVTG